MLHIGDIAFENAASQEQCRLACGDEWDDEEYYINYDELKESFPEMTFEKVSFCAGILTLTKKPHQRRCVLWMFQDISENLRAIPNSWRT